MNKKEFELQYASYLLFDDPIPYKDLLIYPIPMEDYIKFNTCVQSVSVDKNSIDTNNPMITAKIIGMSYLDFLFYMVNQSENGIINISYMLNLLCMCLHINSDDIGFPNEIRQNYTLDIKTNKKDKDGIEIITTTIIDRFDFDNIRKIICYQNLIDLPEDDLTPPALKEKLKEAQDFQNKSKKKMGSLEDQIICLMISTELNLDMIKHMSIRKFEKALSRIDFKIHYEIYKEAECSGMVTFKKGVDHWMSDLTNDDKYSDVKVGLEDFKSKTGFQNIQTVNESVSLEKIR